MVLNTRESKCGESKRKISWINEGGGSSDLQLLPKSLNFEAEIWQDKEEPGKVFDLLPLCLQWPAKVWVEQRIPAYLSLSAPLRSPADCPMKPSTLPGAPRDTENKDSHTRKRRDVFRVSSGRLSRSSGNYSTRKEILPSHPVMPIFPPCKSDGLLWTIQKPVCWLGHSLSGRSHEQCVQDTEFDPWDYVFSPCSWVWHCSTMSVISQIINFQANPC